MPPYQLSIKKRSAQHKYKDITPAPSFVCGEQAHGCSRTSGSFYSSPTVQPATIASRAALCRRTEASEAGGPRRQSQELSDVITKHAKCKIKSEAATLQSSWKEFTRLYRSVMYSFSIFKPIKPLEDPRERRRPYEMWLKAMLGMA